MPTYDYKSAIVTNNEATPRTINSTQLNKGVVRSAVAAFALSTALVATAGQTVGLFRVPAKARVRRLDMKIASTAGTGSWKFGLARTVDNGGTIIDDDILAAAVTVSLAIIAAANPNDASAMNAVTADLRAKTLYELATASFASTGAAGDAEVDIYATVVTVAATTNLPVFFELEYVVD